MNEELPLLLSLKQATELTGLEERYIQKLRKAGLIKVYTTIGGRHKYHKEDLLKHVGIK